MKRISGKKIRELRKAKKLPQWKLAEMVGCTQSTISRMERDLLVRRKHREKVAEVLGGTTPAVLRHGMRVRCKIRREQINDAKICCEDGLFYICQNEREGSSCIDKLGYKYSWCMGDGSTEYLDLNSITDLEIIDEDKVSDSESDSELVSVPDRPETDETIKRWIPTNGRTYFYLSSGGSNNSTVWLGTSADLFRLRNNNVFEHPEDVIRYHFGIHDLRV